MRRMRDSLVALDLETSIALLGQTPQSSVDSSKSFKKAKGNVMVIAVAFLPWQQRATIAYVT